ncbi:MAG TPA: hypothetical protein VMY87_01415 [Armatimonadota bacterium]|nr:hypothetical protein [Armatimonadota bacterium]
MRREGLVSSLLVCCVLGLLGGGAPAWGQSVRWEASVGFGGVCREGGWTPVFVDVSNQGESQAGEIVLPVNERSAVGRRVISYSVPVELPRNSKKRYALYVPFEGVEKIYLRLGRGESEKELSAPRVASREDTLAVVLGGDRGTLNFLSGSNAAPQTVPLGRRDGRGMPVAGTDTGPVIQVGHAGWEGLPESWLGWDGVDAVVLGDAGFASASAEAVEGLLRWVHLGGTLIVPGGTLAPQMAASPIADLLPIEVRGTTTAAHLGELEEWTQQPIERRASLLAEGPLREGASVLCGTKERPLIAVRRVDAGRVAMTAFDFGAAPVKYWDGQTAMWQRLLAQAPPSPSLTVEAEKGAEMGFPHERLLTLADAATYTPAASLVPFWLLLGFLGAYLIVLVPVNYSILRRLDRRELAWVTTPAIVIVFTLGAYAVGYGMRGRAIILNRLGVIEAAANTGLARGRGYVGLFSPGRKTYDLLLAGTAAGARDLTPADERTRGSATIECGAHPKVADVAMNMWTSRAFGVEFLADLEGGIDGVLEWDGSDLRATVENNTGFRLRQCRVVRGSTQGQKKDVKPGSMATWSFGRGSDVGPRDVRSGSGQTRPEVAEGMTVIALRSIFGNAPGYLGRKAIGVRQPYLVGLVDEPLLPVKLDRRGADVNDVNVVIVDLPMRVTPGKRIAVPSWWIGSRTIASEGHVSGGFQGSPPLTISNGSAVFEFQIPFGENGGEAVGLSLTAPYTAQSATGAYQGPGGRAGPGVGIVAPGPGAGGLPLAGSAYNFTTNQWEALPATFPTVAFRHPGAYMSRDGRVLVRVDVPSDTVSFEQIELSAVVNSF